jgi:glycosyltransferase involved in cell wall biosynthesis
MHVAYVTVGRADDPHEWSGLNTVIRSAIADQGCAISTVDQLGASYPWPLRLRRRAASLLGITYALERTPYAASRWSRAVSEKLVRLQGVDAIVATGTTGVSRLDHAAPLALWSDATFNSLRRTYPEYARYSQASIADGDRLERAALARASLVCYASQWAADDAISYYGVSPDKIRVIEFGAIAQSPFTDERAAAAAAGSRDWQAVRFAFVGVDWERKGGDTAIDIVTALNDMGTRSVLTVAGCMPPRHVQRLPFVECAGYLSKKVAADAARLDAILSTSHFLLLPTRAECFGLVFAEAAAFALPSISRAVGGVTTAVRHGHTRLLLPPDATTRECCAAVRPLLEDRDRYLAMCVEAYRDFRRRLNWRTAGGRFVAALREKVAARAAS